jgi:rubrerythrin
MTFRTIGAAVLLGAAAFGAGTVAARAPDQAMSEQTRKNLDTAMHGEALAYAKYQLFAQKARAEGHPEVARIFEQAAQEERFQHFSEEASLAGLVGNTLENVKDAMQGEGYEMDSMYPTFARQARAAGDQAAAQRFEEISRDERKHHDRFQKALDALEKSGVGGSGQGQH